MGSPLLKQRDSESDETVASDSILHSLAVATSSSSCYVVQPCVVVTCASNNLDVVSTTPSPFAAFYPVEVRV